MAEKLISRIWMVRADVDSQPEFAQQIEQFANTLLEEKILNEPFAISRHLDRMRYHVEFARNALTHREEELQRRQAKPPRQHTLLRGIRPEYLHWLQDTYKLVAEIEALQEVFSYFDHVLKQYKEQLEKVKENEEEI